MPRSLSWPFPLLLAAESYPPNLFDHQVDSLQEYCATYRSYSGKKRKIHAEDYEKIVLRA